MSSLASTTQNSSIFSSIPAFGKYAIQHSYKIVPGYSIKNAGKYKKPIAYPNPNHDPSQSWKNGNAPNKPLEENLEQLAQLPYLTDSELFNLHFNDRTVNVGLLSAYPGNDGYYIGRIDCDNKDPELRAKLLKTFQSKKVIVSNTISGNLAVLYRTSEYYSHCTEIFFGDADKYASIGHTSDHVVVPPSKGYSIIQGETLALHELEVLDRTDLMYLGITFDSDPVTVQSFEASDREETSDLSKDWLALDKSLWLIAQSYLLGLSQDVSLGDWGYSDENNDWIQVYFCCRSLANTHPSEGDRIKDRFTQFAQIVGEKSGKFDNAAIEMIDHRWGEPDSGKVNLGKLILWAKNLWNPVQIKKAPQEKQKEIEQKVASLSTNKSVNFQDIYDLCGSDPLRYLPELQKSTNGQYGQYGQIKKSYIEFARDKDLLESKTPSLPFWNIEDNQVTEIFKKLPGTSILRSYVEQRGMNPAVALFTYLVHMRVVVPKVYERMDFSGKSINNGLLIFILGDTNTGKSNYTRLASVYSRWNAAIEELNKENKKQYKKDVAFYSKALKAAKTKGDLHIDEPDEFVAIPIWTCGDFTMQGFKKSMRKTEYGRLILLDESYDMLSIDNSGQKAGSAAHLTRLVKLWNGYDEGSEDKASNGDSLGSVAFKCSLLAGIQTGLLKSLKSDTSNFFGRCQIIPLTEMVRDRITELNQSDVDISVMESLQIIKDTYNVLLTFKDQCQVFSEQQTSLYFSNNTRYPFSDRVANYLDTIADSMATAKGKRASYLGKVKDNFWRIVQALEIAYTGHSQNFDWEDLYKDAILLSQWLIEQYEQSLIMISSYRENENIDTVDLRDKARKAIQDFYSIPSNESIPFQKFLDNRRKVLQSLGKSWRDITRQIKDELTAQGKIPAI